MKLYNIPATVTALIFDIDSTLYTNPEYTFEQTDVQVRHYAQLQHISYDEAKQRITAVQELYKKENPGKTLSFGNTMVALGYSIEESIRWRETLFSPEQFLSQDPRLQQTLALLQPHFAMICVTNNPTIPARKTLEALGVSTYFQDIIALDTTKVSKPHPLPLAMALEKTKSLPQQIVSIGDRYTIDIELPVKMGMGGILVSGVEEVYDIPRILLPKT